MSHLLGPHDPRIQSPLTPSSATYSPVSILPCHLYHTHFEASFVQLCAIFTYLQYYPANYYLQSIHPCCQLPLQQISCNQQGFLCWHSLYLTCCNKEWSLSRSCCLSTIAKILRPKVILNLFWNYGWAFMSFKGLQSIFINGHMPQRQKHYSLLGHNQVLKLPLLIFTLWSHLFCAWASHPEVNCRIPTWLSFW